MSASWPSTSIAHCLHKLTTWNTQRAYHMPPYMLGIFKHRWSETPCISDTLHTRHPSSQPSSSQLPSSLLQPLSSFLLSAFLTSSLGERVVCVRARVFARTPRRHTHTHTHTNTCTNTHSLTHVYHTNPPTHPPPHSHPHTPCGQWGPSRRGV